MARKTKKEDKMKNQQTVQFTDAELDEFIAKYVKGLAWDDGSPEIKRVRVFPVSDSPEIIEKIRTTVQQVGRQAFVAAWKRKLEREWKEKEAQKPKTIKLTWSEGTIVSGWSVPSAWMDEMLRWGLAYEIRGWGVKVPQEVVDMLGTEFTPQQAQKYAEKKKAEKEAAKRKEKEEEEEKFRRAKETGQPVEIRRYFVPCSSKNEECDTDIVTVWAMPDGTKKETRHHTW